LNNVTYKLARRAWLRQVLIGAVAGTVSGLVLEVLTTAAHMLV
jgi:hypothetical protein